MRRKRKKESKKRHKFVSISNIYHFAIIIFALTPNGARAGGGNQAVAGRWLGVCGLSGG
jgi:hypothetical protein